MTVFIEKFNARIFFRSNFPYLQKNICITEKIFITLAVVVVFMIYKMTKTTKVMLLIGLTPWTSLLRIEFHRSDEILGTFKNMFPTRKKICLQI